MKYAFLTYFYENITAAVEAKVSIHSEPCQSSPRSTIYQDFSWFLSRSLVYYATACQYRCSVRYLACLWVPYRHPQQKTLHYPRFTELHYNSKPPFSQSWTCAKRQWQRDEYSPLVWCLCTRTRINWCLNQYLVKFWIRVRTSVAFVQGLESSLCRHRLAEKYIRKTQIKWLSLY